MWRNRGIDGILSGSAGLLGTWESSLDMWLMEEGIVYFVFEKDQLLCDGSGLGSEILTLCSS